MSSPSKVKVSTSTKHLRQRQADKSGVPDEWSDWIDHARIIHLPRPPGPRCDEDEILEAERAAVEETERPKQAAATNRPRHPELSFNRIWSGPIEKVDEEIFIASVLAEPTFEDVLACACYYGLNEVARIYRLMREDGELKPIDATECGQMLTTIGIGFARAAGASRD